MEVPLDSRKNGEEWKAGETEPLKEQEFEDDDASWPSAWFNITNVTVGAGTLSLPYAIRLCGFVLGVLLVILCAALASFSLRLLLWTAHLSNQNSYQDVASFTYGKKASIAVDLVIILQCFAVVLAYTIIIGALLPPTFQTWADNEDHILLSRAAIMIMIVSVLIFPLSCMRRLHFLRHTSLMALLCMLYVGVLVAVWAVNTDFNDIANGNVDEKPNVVPTVQWASVGPQIFYAMPIMAFAFTSHIQVYKIYQEMNIRDIPFMMKVVNLSVTSCLTLYLTVGMFGYLTFYKVVEGMVLDNYTDEENIFVALAKCGLAICLIFSSPLFLHPLRENILHVCFPNSPWINEFSWARQIGMTFSILVCTTIVAIFVPDVADVISLTGSVCSTSVMYIFPGLLYINLEPRCPDHGTTPAKLRRYGAMFIVGWGIMMMVAGTTVSVLEFAGVDAGVD